ncbi:MAG: ATP-dependent Clp protease proteolytic subunit [Planctomycetota bacterium]|jgi:ATP-dependent Clp protease, protease subunit|uniref:ClpP family protease n=1 Tax=uncultured Gimesia sp. TaxID=1678688 RepID=UPI00263432C7|nr:ATP-dependent Clp protease proteolytic subunit [uncultured Gimesia sp.]
MNKRRRLNTTSSLKSYPEKVTSFRSHSAREKEPDWEIAISGDLGDKESDLVSRLVDLPRGTRGTIYFDSPGGSVYSGLTLASLIRLRKLNVAGVALGECSSAAILPFAACKHRFVTCYTTLLFHPVRWQSEDDVRFEEAAEWARHFKIMETDFDRLQAELFGCEQSLLDKWTRPGRFVSGPELVDAGLAQLIDPFAAEDQWKTIEAR